MTILGRPITIIEAPSNLGLKPPTLGKVPGVWKMPDALRREGLGRSLNAMDGGRVVAPPYYPERDASTGIRNTEAIRSYAFSLAHEIGFALGYGRFPLVVGGDCSILLGGMLALRRRGRYGLFFIDGHRDFLTPAQSQTGGAAGMDLALVSGRGPESLTNFDGLKPLVRDQDTVVFGFRDVEDPNTDAFRDIFQTQMYLYGLNSVREIGLESTVARSIAWLRENKVEGIWIHLDADVLDDNIMPAVDSPQIGGLSYAELTEVLRLLLRSGLAVGMEITIFDPELDVSGKIARDFTKAIVNGFNPIR